MNYSVLMSVYYKEKPEYLRQSMESIFAQTVPTDNFVLVCDGPLSDELDQVISEAQSKHGNVMHTIRLEKNGGLGNALRIGVQACKNELIARMDSDDISRPDRCEKQLEVFKKHPEYSIVGGIVEEFSIMPENVDSKRVVPEYNEEIRIFAKARNPFNHPTVMIKKTDVLAAGNYQNVRFMQDYYLWIEMLIKGFKGYNIQKPLVWMRANDELFMRRSGKQYIQIQIRLFRRMLECGFITMPQFIASCTIRVCSGVAPNCVRQFIFKKSLRIK